MIHILGRIALKCIQPIEIIAHESVRVGDTFVGRVVAEKIDGMEGRTVADVEVGLKMEG